MLNDIDAAEDWLDGWAAKVNIEAERAVTLSRRVAALTSTAKSRDGSITVTVGASGTVNSLELDDRVQTLAGRDLSRQVMDVLRRAQAGLSEQVSSTVQQTVGADTETGRAVIDSYEARFPEQPEIDQVQANRHGV